jgi:hypothetical protein
MGRELKRVPLDFDYPLNKVWYGYYNKHFNFCHSEYSAGCEGCRAYAKIKGIELHSYGCPDFEKFYNLPVMPVDPPEGEGFQLWETTSEGSPVSPVFESLEELCEWCADNATTFAKYKATKEEWYSMLSGDFVHHKVGNAIFI